MTLLFFSETPQSAVLAEEPPLIEIQSLNPRIQVDLRYKTADNFMKEVLYPDSARAFLRPEAARALSGVQERLEKQGFGLKVLDAYRPLAVQKKMWAHTPIEGYVANPAKGSNHNRGAAVDVTLANLEGQELSMPSAYDEFSERAHRDYSGGTDIERKNRKILEDAMHAEGFRGITTEWWHFDLIGAKEFPVLDLPFDDVG